PFSLPSSAALSALPSFPTRRSSDLGPLAATVAAALFAPWLALMRRRLRAACIVHIDQVFGIACSGSMGEARLREIDARLPPGVTDRKSTRLNSSHRTISYAVFCLK